MYTDHQVNCLDILSRRKLICAVSKDAEESFKKTVEVDRLIDTLREASDNEVSRSALIFFKGFVPETYFSCSRFLFITVVFGQLACDSTNPPVTCYLPSV